MSEEDKTRKGQTPGKKSWGKPEGQSEGLQPPQDSQEPMGVDGEDEELLDLDASRWESEHPVGLSSHEETTESIVLDALFSQDITDSGSFDIRGEIWKTTFGRMLQALPIGALLVDDALSITAANEACRTISADYEDILGSQLCDLYATEFGKQRARSVSQAVLKDRKPRVLFGMLDICGKKVWGRATLRSIRIMSDRFILVLLENLTVETEQLILNQKQHKALQKEIAERKHSEEALKCSETRFRQIYDKAPLMMLSLDRDGTIRSANAKCVQSLGYSQEELLGQKIHLLLSEESKVAFPLSFRTLWTTGEIRDCSSRYLTKDRKQIEALIDGVIVEDSAWGPVSLLTVRDVTHEWLLEKQLREAQKMQALGTLAGGVAHDFNNLLQIIFGYAELVMMRLKKDSPNYQGLRTIRETARRGSELVKQVLAFSRRVESNPRPFDLNHEVVKSSQLLERTIPKMISIQVNLDESLHTIFADPIQVEQIVLNLAVNAKDAMPDGGTLTLETRNVSFDKSYCRQNPEVQPGDYVCLRISDTGHGMEREVMEHIFEPFFSTKKPGEGTGLGLSTVFGLVKIHGGHISCDSEPGRGTVMQVYFPAIEQQVGWSVDTTIEMPAFGTETILLIDDEEFVRTWGKDLLTHAGYTVVDATNGREGLQIYRQKQDEISLVILDLIMPEMGGKQCLEELLRLDPNLKAVIASGFPIDRKSRESLAKQAKAIISKPFQANELLRVVRRVIDRD